MSWQVETAIFMLKARLGDAVNARSEAAWRDEIALKAVTHHIMIAHAA